jgi:hypothetical protein
MRRVWIFSAPAQPAEKMAMLPVLMKKGICRPSVSPNGAQNKGPIANPKTNNERPIVATSVLTWKWSSIWRMLPL